MRLNSSALISPSSYDTRNADRLSSAWSGPVIRRRQRSMRNRIAAPSSKAATSTPPQRSSCEFPAARSAAASANSVATRSMPIRRFSPGKPVDRPATHCGCAGSHRRLAVESAAGRSPAIIPTGQCRAPKNCARPKDFSTSAPLRRAHEPFASHDPHLHHARTD